MSDLTSLRRRALLWALLNDHSEMAERIDLALDDIDAHQDVEFYLTVNGRPVCELDKIFGPVSRREVFCQEIYIDDGRKDIARLREMFPGASVGYSEGRCPHRCSPRRPSKYTPCKNCSECVCGKVERDACA